MAARGNESKSIITKTILDTFNGAFINGKEIRIPMREGGEPLEIKVTLTCAKDLCGGQPTPAQPKVASATVEYAPTPQELDNLSTLLKGLA